MKSDCYPNGVAQKNNKNSNNRSIFKIFSLSKKRSVKTLLFAVLIIFALTGNALAQGTYIWNGATSDFQLASNWTPSRGILNAGDVLIFQNLTQTVTNI